MNGSDAVALDYDVTAAMHGDSHAFDRLVARYASVVCAIALAIVRNVEASEDVAQEVFLAAWRGVKKLRNPASFLPWLRQVTRNRAREWVRTHGREVSDDDLLQSAIDHRPSPADSLLRGEEREILAVVIDELPDDAREVIVLYYREGSSARHVAALLGIREEAVKQRLSRARSRIREEMLRRFGTAVARTAPGAAFTTGVGLAIASVSPSAAAATLLGGADGGTQWAKLLILAKGAGIGGAAGVAGVIIGMRNAVKRARTEEQRIALRRFTGHAVITVVLAAIGLSASSFVQPEWLFTAIVWVGFVVTLGYLYRVRLPRIIAPILAAELSEDPAAAKRHRREEIWSRIGFLGGVISGTAGLVWGLLAN